MDIKLMISIFPDLLSGTVITLQLLVSSMFFGLIIGLIFAILRINKNPIINKFAYGYSYFFRGTPLLVQLYLIYYGLANIELLRNSFFWAIIKEPYWCAIIAFSLNTGAYTSEILRSAFQTIKKGYIEAAQSLGVTKKITFYRIQSPPPSKPSKKSKSAILLFIYLRLSIIVFYVFFLLIQPVCLLLTFYRIVLLMHY